MKLTKHERHKNALTVFSSVNSLRSLVDSEELTCEDLEKIGNRVLKLSEEIKEKKALEEAEKEQQKEKIRKLIELAEEQDIDLSHLASEISGKASKASPKKARPKYLFEFTLDGETKTQEAAMVGKINNDSDLGKYIALMKKDNPDFKRSDIKHSACD